MSYVKKSSHKKLYIAIALIVIISVASGAAAYLASIPKPVVVGVKAGDSFTYTMQGISVLGTDATTPEYFSQYNDTQYFKVTVTDIQNKTVTLSTEWKFKNGTEINGTQTINVGNGEKSSTDSFWAIYPSNLAVNDLLRPEGFDGVKVNATDTRTYSSGDRKTNFFRVDNEFFDINDPTRSTYRYVYNGVSFDQQTGMLVSMQNWEEYNNPQYRLIVLYTLIDTTVWEV
jgi:hypothetical protein